MIHTAVVPAHNLPWLETKLAKLNKRATKLKSGGFVLNIVKEMVIEMQDLKVKYSIPAFEITITGETPKIDGWEFAGTIDSLGKGEVVFNMVPGFPEPPSHYRKLWNECNCDHCGVSRYRKQTFILRRPALFEGVWEDTNEPYLISPEKWQVVGRSCLKDYMGHLSAEQLTKIAQYIDSLMGDVHDSCGRRPLAQVYPVTGIILRTIAQVKARGYMSSKKAKELTNDERYVESTSQIVRTSYMPSFGKSHPFEDWQFSVVQGCKRRGIKQIIGKKDVAEARAIMAWALRQPDGEYMSNVKSLVRLGVASQKHMAYIIGLVAFYRKSLNRPVVIAPISRHIGTVGEKITVSGRVVYTYVASTQWGASTLIKLVTPEGNVVNWWSTGHKGIEKGTILELKGTVKSHDEYQGKLGTNLTRAKILSQLNTSAPVFSDTKDLFQVSV